MVRELEGCTVNKKVSSIPLRGHGGGVNRECLCACARLPCQPSGPLLPRPRARQTDGREGRRDGRTNGRTRGRMDRWEVFQESMVGGGGRGDGQSAKKGEI